MRSQLLEGLTCESQTENIEKQGIGAAPWLVTLDGWRGVLELRDGTRRNWQASITYMDLHKTNTKWLVHNWNTSGVRTSHEQLKHTRLTTARTWGSHHLPLYSILCTSPQGPHPNGFLSWDSQVGVPKFPHMGLLRFWRHITWHENLRL
jgi:hypothetical protein